MKVAIVGCGYSGQILVRRLIRAGNQVKATTTTEAKLSQLAALGAEPVVLRAEDGRTLERGLAEAEAVVYLAPPVAAESAERFAERVSNACGPKLKTFVYGSSTGAFGDHGNNWVDEATPPRSPSGNGERRLAAERALRSRGLPLKVVRIAGIYGPGRTMRAAIHRGALILIDGAPPTSRIHVEDLARILEAMIGDDAPPLAIACDEEPTPSIEVARYTCKLLSMEPPAPVSMEEARRVLSPTAQEMKLGGRRCRSLVREKLIGSLSFPTYREGVRSSLEAEGALRAGSGS